MDDLVGFFDGDITDITIVKDLEQFVVIDTLINTERIEKK